MKQTAIEWFFIQLTEIDYGCINKTFLQNDNTLAGHKLRELFEQAKQMEKEQIIDSFGVGCQVESTRLIGYQDIAEQYYNETYESNTSKTNDPFFPTWEVTCEDKQQLND